MTKIAVRKSTVADARLILQFITELAEYEKAAHEVIATTADIERTLFSDDSTANAIICEIDDTPCGFAVYFFNYSTWLGKNGLYLEDLYVTPGHRGAGAGLALFRELARIALDHNCDRLDWSVLTWNEPAIKFYQSIGAKAQDEWMQYRLQTPAIKALAMG